MDKKIRLIAPWVNFYREIEALFKDDPQIKIVFDEDELSIKLYVDNEEKADALTQLLPSEKVFGNVVLNIVVIPANKLQTMKTIFESAFSGNPALSYIATVEGAFNNPITYIVFQNKVVQYYNDDLGDIYGNCSTLYQNIAKDVFGELKGVFYCTDKPGDNK